VESADMGLIFFYCIEWLKINKLGTNISISYVYTIQSFNCWSFKTFKIICGY